jgi:hypothetical protein
MKKIIFTVLTLASVTGMVAGQQQTGRAEVMAAASEKSTCTWQTLTHDFGSITRGTPVSFTYEFTNTGNTPLVIASVKPACGCTTQNYTREAVAPGEKGMVTLTFNAASAGRFNKSAAVTTNGETFVLTFSGEVTEK